MYRILRYLAASALMLLLALSGPLVLASEINSRSASDSAPIDQNQAVKSLREMFPELCSGREFTATLQNDPGGDGRWELYWGTSFPASAQEKISASINAVSGRITHFSYQPDSAYYAYNSSYITSGQAKQIAEDFLNKYHGAEVPRLKLNVDYPYTYTSERYNIFYWNRIENGIVTDQDGVVIGVDLLTGQIHQYTYIWTDAELPAPVNIIPPSEFRTVILDKYGVCPVYKIPLWNPSELNTAVPVYTINTPAQSFNAGSFEPLDMFGRVLPDTKTYIESITPNPGGSVTLENSDQELPANQLMSAAERFFEQMGAPRGEIRNTGGGASCYGSVCVKGQDYSIIGEDDQEYMTVSIDTRNADIVGFNRHYPGQSNPANSQVSCEQALSSARNFIDLLSPGQVIQRQSVSYNEDNRLYQFFFSPLINGIPMESATIYAEVDKNSGQTVSYQKVPALVNCSGFTHLISPEQARQSFEQNLNLKLKYIFLRDQNYQPVGTAILAYSLDSFPYLDASSGKKIKPTYVAQGQPDNHWASAALSVLKERGLLSAEDLSNPDYAVTRRQALELLLSSANSHMFHVLGGSEEKIDLKFTNIDINSPDYDLLTRAVKRGMIVNYGEFYPDQLLSREEMALWLTNILGYRDIAEMEDHITLDFNDVDLISVDLHNYVAISNALGLLNPDRNGNFRPQAPCTLAETAVVFLRLESKLQQSISW